MKRSAILLFMLSAISVSAETKPKPPPAAHETKTATIKPEELTGWESLTPELKAMLEYALSLTARNLGYKAGSADPEQGGTDCSGFVYHVLQKHGHTAAPRQSNDMYEWTWKAGTFRACNSHSMDTFEFAALSPGDLLFWVNSTQDGKTDRDPPVTHVMIYLGKRKSDGHPVLAGASDGRSYDGQQLSGVSIFDFQLPAPGSAARFIGYAKLPAGAPAETQPQSPAPAKPKKAKK